MIFLWFILDPKDFEDFGFYSTSCNPQPEKRFLGIDLCHKSLGCNLYYWREFMSNEKKSVFKGKT
ncbi:MAG: hypothetical protein AMJ89_04265 [candidate division Zixibacteria bacterium SM23_73]|nr:MAG: hypothetical protein AMJ89_04265 [candidate division Zixibacteria bacterium SM23_73]